MTDQQDEPAWNKRKASGVYKYAGALYRRAPDHAMNDSGGLSIGSYGKLARVQN
jgi:hypothetical protein